MSRLPPLPELDWREDGAPVSKAAGDVYYSADDGLAESRAVFLAGCGLPGAWAGRRAFTVAELGFGTGLNVLALWDLWRREGPAGAWLHVVSVEGCPMDAGEAARALSRWSELAPLAERLLAVWPDRARGVRRVDFSADRLSLTLHVDDAEAALSGAAFCADAWFLDGFSPAKNAAMWAPALYPLIAARSAPDARLATYTVAGAVRRGLSEAGFDVEKRPGHGRKRERLEARFSGAPAQAADLYALRGPDTAPRRVAVLGAGVAGAALAAALVRRGVQATVFDRAPSPASGASGNALALLMPRLDAADTVQARLLIDAYLHARAAYRALPREAWEETDARQTPRDDGEAARFAKVLGDPPLGLEDLEALAGGGLLHKRALVLRPRRIVEALLQGVETRFGAPCALDAGALTVDGERFDAAILASGMAAAHWLPEGALSGRLGQVEHVAGLPDAPASAMAAGRYAIAAGGERLWGATFKAHDGPPVETEQARAANAEALNALSPWWRVQVKTAEPVSRAGVRATTPDRLPLIGAAPDAAAAQELFEGLRHGRATEAAFPVRPGLHVATGFGARGFTWAPWAASILAARLLGEPAPASLGALQAVSPARLVLRALKRGG